jgi:hypothetical protein
MIATGLVSNPMGSVARMKVQHKDKHSIAASSVN